MNRKERAEQLEQTLDEAIAELETQLNEGHTEGFLQLLDWYARFHQYSPANCLLILIQKRDATLCAGYRKWQAMGYHVRAGEKAIWIRAPWMRKVPDPETGELVEKLVGYLAVPIFDISQLVEDVEIPDQPDIPLERECVELYHRSSEAIQASGITVIEQRLPKGVRGESHGGKIVIQPGMSPERKFLVLLHELVHEVLHHDDSREETTQRQRELEAEAGSYLLARLHGLTNPYSRDYILHYDGTVEKLHESLTRIHLAVRKSMDILGNVPAVAEAA